jgi:hypothetical protein
LTSERTYVRMYERIYVFFIISKIRPWHLHVYFLRVCMYVCIYVYACMHAGVHRRMYSCMHVCMCKEEEERTNAYSFHPLLVHVCLALHAYMHVYLRIARMWYVVVSIYVCFGVSMCMHVWLWTCMCIEACQYVCKYVCKYVCVHAMHVSKQVMYACMYVWVVCVYVCMYVCMHA